MHIQTDTPIQIITNLNEMVITIITSRIDATMKVIRNGTNSKSAILILMSMSENRTILHMHIYDSF